MKLAILFLLPMVLRGQQDYFPSRLHKFVFRNWELGNLDRIAQVAATSPQNISTVGRSMGLPAKLRLTEDQLRRIYITVIRQNWDVLPEEQLIQLLGWTKQKYQFTLKEDDFLDVKLGAKPKCEPVRYEGEKADAIAAISSSLGWCRAASISSMPPTTSSRRECSGSSTNRTGSV